MWFRVVNTAYSFASARRRLVVMTAVVACAVLPLGPMRQRPGVAHAATVWFVTSAADHNDGACDADCTLREAITKAQTGDGIGFLIPPLSSPHLITLTLGPLPALAPGVGLDGETEGSGIPGDPPLVKIDGSLLGGTADGLVVTGSPSQALPPCICTLSLLGFPGAAIRVTASSSPVQIDADYIGIDPATNNTSANGVGIEVDGAAYALIGDTDVIPYSANLGPNVISGNTIGIKLVGATFAEITTNYIGTTPTGTAARPNSTGVLIEGDSHDNTIGFGGHRTIISGNSGVGIQINNTGGGNFVTGNYIGVDASGTGLLPNGGGSFANVAVLGSNNVIGGTAGTTANACTGECNVIAGAEVNLSGNSNEVYANYIGTDVHGAASFGGGAEGIFIAGSNNVIGGTTSGLGNLIVHNADAGVRVDSGIGNAILGNAIHDNGGLGIDLNSDGVTPNDAGDADSGPNDLQNFPVLHSFGAGVGSVSVNFELHSEPNSTYEVDVYEVGSCDASGHGEGDTYLGSVNVSTDGAGNYGPNNETITTPVNLAFDSVITATATLAVSPNEFRITGSTSEFSACSSGTLIDTDLDGYPDIQEVALGRNPLVYCSIMRADVDGNGIVNILDLSAVAARYHQNVPPAPARDDQGPTFDNVINILDLSKMAGVYNKKVSTCP